VALFLKVAIFQHFLKNHFFISPDKRQKSSRYRKILTKSAIISAKYFSGKFGGKFGTRAQMLEPTRKYVGREQQVMRKYSGLCANRRWANCVQYVICFAIWQGGRPATRQFENI